MDRTKPEAMWHVRRERLREAWTAIALAAIAAGAAWAIAKNVFGHDAPFFAPVAAISVIGLSVGQRLSRAVEIALGQAVGILVADALVVAVGTGTLTIMLVSAMAMVVAVLVRPGALVVQQAAVSAVLVATLQPPGTDLSTTRFVDALIGGGVAIVLNSLIFPANPLALARRRAGPLLRGLAHTLDGVADALASRDLEAAEAALLEARALDEQAVRFAGAVQASRDQQRTAPIHRHTREAVAGQMVAAGRLDLAVRNVRVLARRARRAVARGDDVPAAVIDAIHELAGGTRDVLAALEGGELSTDRVLTAAQHATAALEEQRSLSVTVLIAQVRSMVQDLLQAVGYDEDSALRAIDDS